MYIYIYVCMCMCMYKYIYKHTYVKNLLQSIEDRHRSGSIGDYMCIYIYVYVYIYIQMQRICYNLLKIDTEVD
jgi:hypothetical protein